MRNRYWLYLLFGIIVVALLTYWAGENGRLQKTLIQQHEQSREEREEALNGYLADQTDARKLVSLAKQLEFTDSKSLQLIIERAYELEPNNRDILILASNYHPELKEKITEVDPLYKIKVDPVSSGP